MVTKNFLNEDIMKIIYIFIIIGVVTFLGFCMNKNNNENKNENHNNSTSITSNYLDSLRVVLIR